MVERKGGGRRPEIVWGAGALALALCACNSLFGIDDASVSPGGGAGDAGAAGSGGGAGASGMPMPGGGGGGPGAGAGGAAGSGGTAGSANLAFDRSFGDAGLAALAPMGVYADGYLIKGLRVQPNGLPLVAALAQLKVRDYVTFGAMASGFLTRLSEAGAVDTTFGALGYVMSHKQYLSQDKEQRLFFDPQTGTPLWDVEGLYCADGCENYGELILANTDGQSVLRVERYADPFANAVLFSSKGCFILDAQTLPPEPLPPRYMTVSPCGGAWEPATEGSVATALPPFADDVVLHEPARLDPTPSGADRFLVPIAQPSTGSVGAFEIEHGGGTSVSTVTAAGGVGYLLFRPDTLDTTLARKIDGIAYDAASGRVYVAGATARIDGSFEPFLSRVRYADGALDASLGDAGTTGRWSCLVLDAAGRPIVAGVRNGENVAARFDAAGQLDAAFAPGGYLKLPFAPQACTLDGAGRLLVVGAQQVGYGAKVFAVRIFNRDGEAPAPDVAPSLPAPTACAVADDLNEPNDTPETGFPLPGMHHKCFTTDWASLFVGETDVDWFSFPAPNECPYSSPTPNAEVAVSDAAGTVEACVYVDSTALPPGSYYCQTGTLSTLGTLRGCCGAGTAKVSYYSAAAPDQSIVPANVRVRLTPSVFAQRCDAYKIALSFRED